MSKVKVNYVDLKAFVHATEDIDKVVTAISRLIPKDIQESIKQSITTVKGHYGNEITIIDIRIPKRRARDVLKNIVCSLTNTDRSILLATLESRVDRKTSHLYLRISKQEAYLGRVRLMDGSDVIKLVIGFSRVSSIDDLRNYLEELSKEC